MTKPKTGGPTPAHYHAWLAAVSICAHTCQKHTRPYLQKQDGKIVGKGITQRVPHADPNFHEKIAQMERLPNTAATATLIQDFRAELAGQEKTLPPHVYAMIQHYLNTASPPSLAPPEIV